MIRFDELVARLRIRLTQPLPGDQAHEPLRATPVGPLKPVFNYTVPPKPGGVLILLYRDGDKIKFPLTQRADYNGAHGGQISFPGGKQEPGEDTTTTALRECEEEIGVSRNDIQVIGRLSDFFVIPSNFMVTPVVGVCNTKPLFVADPVEVVNILECDLDDLLRDDAVHVKEILAAKRFAMLAPHFVFENQIVWGATAMMLNELRIIIRPIADLVI